MFRTVKPSLFLALFAVSWFFPSGVNAQNDLYRTVIALGATLPPGLVLAGASSSLAGQGTSWAE